MYQLLSDTESVRWLNHAIENMWPICMEKIVSQLLRPIIPWFLDKFKPWTVVCFPSYILIFRFLILQHPTNLSRYRQYLTQSSFLQTKASIQELYMGRNPPLFTSMRVLPETSDDDHLVGITILWPRFLIIFPFLLPAMHSQCMYVLSVMH
jgi:hypothetical protein